MIFAELQGGVELDGTELGAEFLLRVRVVEMTEESIEVTSMGDTEPRILQGRNTAKLMLLAVRKESNTEIERDK